MQLLTISENILLFVSGAGILQAVFLSTLIYFHPKSEKSTNIFLALFIICICLPMLLPLGQKFFSWQVVIFLAPFGVIQGPLLYLYIRSFKEVITWRKAWPHLVIFVVYIFLISWVSFGVGSNYPPTTNMPADVLHSPATIIPVTSRYAQMLLYYFLSRRELNSYQRSIQHLFSETSRINLSWVKLLINGYVLLILAAVGLYSVVLRYTEYFDTLLLINAALVTPYIYIAAYKGIYQPSLWQIQPGMSKEKVEEEMNNAKEIESAKTNEEKQPKGRMMENKVGEIISKIMTVIKNDKLYQEPELTLQNLADRIQYPSYQVSQAINEGLKKNFYDLINSYRVEEAKSLLLDEKNKNFTVLSIGFEAGFNSKTTFNTVFKKFTGLTPTEYRNKQMVGFTN